MNTASSSSPLAAGQSGDAEWLIGGGEMGACIRLFDWQATRLGARHSWPQSLRGAVNLILANQFPMAILWGSDLIFLYNDAYRIIAGNKHPGALGHSTRDVWPEVWEFNRTVFESVMARGETVNFADQFFRIDRSGAMEDAYFTLCYSPIRTESGLIGGTLVVLLETTKRIRLEREQQEKEDRLRIFIHTSPVALAMFDREIRYLEASGRWRADNKLGERDIHGLSHYELFPTIPERWKEVHRRALAGEVIRAEEDHYTRADGSDHWMRWEVRPWHNAAGAVGGILMFSDNITERKQAEEALKASELALKEAQALSHTASWQLDFDEAGTHWSGSAELHKIYGYPPDKQLAMQTGFDRMHPDDQKRMADNWHAFLRGEVSGEWEHRIVVDGQTRWLQVRAQTHFAPDGHLARVTGTLHDITERKLAEIALRESNKRLEEITFCLADWVWEVDEKGFYTYSSQQGFTYFGPHREDVIGKTPFDFMPPDEAKRVGAIFAEAIVRKASIKDLENWNITKNGERICLLTNGVPILDEAGNLKGYRGVDKDITAQRASEKTLRLHGAALEAAANAIVITDRQGIIEWANPAFASLSGWSLTEAIGRNPRDLVKSGKHDASFYRQMWDTLLAGKVWHGEIINRRKDGALRTEEMTVTPVRGEQSEISHFIAIKQDITDHKTMEAHFLQAQRMEAIGALAGGIAHDLNNILAPIMMVTGLVKDKLTDEGDRELLAMTHASAQRGGEVIKQLLIFSRGQDGERKVLQPRHLITEMGRLMRETFPREIKVQQQLPAVLWMIHADPTQVHQVLMNLCVNARDAMPDGGQLTIGAANVTMVEGDPRLPQRAKPGPHVVITVSDTGHGIPSQIKHLIFDPFFSTKPVGKGTGLGLSTVLGIVHSHGGFVDVDSTPNKGSTFKVYLPAIPDEVEAATEVLAAPAVQSTGTQTILVVDDERNVREMTRILLERQHYRVLTAVNGEDALVQYLGHRTEITLMLTDLMMPVMSGVNLIRALRVINPALKIIAMSGLTETVEAEKLAALGVPDVLTKPCSGPTLLDAVHRRLSGA